MEEKSASAAPDKSLQPPNCIGDQISPPNPQIPNLSSPIVSPSSSSMDLPQISAPQLGHAQIQMTPSGALVFPSKTPAMSQQQSNLMSPTSNFVMQPAPQRSGPMSPIEQIHKQQFDPAMDAQGAIGQRMYGAQIGFGGQQQQQLGSAMARPGMMKPMQSSLRAAHFNSQKLISKRLQRRSSLSAMSPQQSGLTPNEQSTAVQGSISQQQWLKKMQAGMPSLVSPYYHIQQQQQRQQQHAILPQQLSSPQPQQKSLGLRQGQMPQSVLKPGHVLTELYELHQYQMRKLRELQQLQQHHHEQQSPPVPGFTISKSLTGSQPGIPASDTNVPAKIISHGLRDGSLILDRKRPIKNLVLQAQLHLHNKCLKQVRELQAQQMVSYEAKRLEAIQLTDSMGKSEQLYPPAASFYVMREIPQL